MKEHTIISLWKEVVNKAPDRRVIFDENKTLTARQFDDLSDRIASALPANVNRVGIIMDHP